MNMKKKDPWSDPDPQPGDFDGHIAAMGPEEIQHLEGNPDAEVVPIDTDDVDGWLRRRRAERERKARERSSGAQAKP